MAENKRFLDSNGVAYLWEKINLFFSQIGHRHETSDVNGLDEYMEENAKAIRDTERVVEELSELPLYPSQEQLGKIYAYEGKLYRAKKLNTLTLDFSKIPVDEETGLVTREIFMDFINQNGMNIVMDYENEGEDDSDFRINGGLDESIEKKHDVLYIHGDFVFSFERRSGCEDFNHWNSVYIKGYSATYQSDYNDDNEESYPGYFHVFADDLDDSGAYNNVITTTSDYPPEDETSRESFGVDGSYSDMNYVDYFGLTDGDENYEDSMPYLLKSLTLQLASCASREDYENNIFSDFLVWEEVSEEELPIEDTTPATEETRKRFYRETPNDNIYVTDKEEHYEPGGFEIIINCNTISQKNDEEVKELIDPENLWVDYIDEVTNCYGAPFLNNKPPINFTPLRIGTSNPGNIALEATQNVVLKFSPYFQYYNGEWQSETAEEDADITIYLNGDEYYNITIPRYQGGNNIESLQYYEISIPIGYIDIEVSRRVYLHTISHGNKETTYKWSQIAKVQDIKDAINALPEVARTGSYTDLFNKPCIGDVQTYDWPSNEDLPIIDEGTGNCDNRLKQLLRWNNSLYTAVVNESGLTVDLRDFSKKYNTQGYCGNKLRTYIFEDRINAVSGAYQDYFVTGNTILIQNTKGIGMQIGSTNSYGEMLLAMISEEDDQRYLFNNVEVTLQSWSSDGEKTTDNANIYVEVGTSSYQESQVQRDVESDLILFVAVGTTDTWGILKKVNGEIQDLTENELQNILNTSGNTLIINNTVHSIIDFSEYSDGDGIWCNIGNDGLDNYDNIDYNWAYDEWRYNHDGYHIYFRQTVTEYEQILTPQQTKNVWFKRYGDEYEEEWAETVFKALFYNIENNLLVYHIGSDVGDSYEFIESLNHGDKLKINDVELIVNYTEDTGKPTIYFDYVSNYPQDGWYMIYQLHRTHIQNPVLRETVSLQGTNCDYLKIWTQYDEDPEQYGRRGVIKTIMFNDLRYEYDPNPKYNRDIYKKDYWKQISGNGSIKVIDLTGDE